MLMRIDTRARCVLMFLHVSCVTAVMPWMGGRRRDTLLQGPASAPEVGQCYLEVDWD